MFETVKTALITWNQRSTDMQKLQHSYIVLLMLTVFGAGLVSLFSGDRSRELMYVGLALITTVVINFVVWSLLKTTLLEKLPRNRRTAQPAARTARRR